jgi:hypothetical protein
MRYENRKKIQTPSVLLTIPTGTYHKNLMIRIFFLGFKKMFCMVETEFFRSNFTTELTSFFLSFLPPLAFDLAASFTVAGHSANRRFSASYGEGRKGRTDGTRGERYCSHR